MIFRQILFSEEIEHFLTVAKSNLKRSSYGGTKTGQVRTSKQTWLHDKTFELPENFMKNLIPEGVKNPYKDGYLMAQNIKQPPILPANYTKYIKIIDNYAYKLSQKIQLATQLHIMGVYSSESYQIANYGIGGQYSEHWDTAGFFEERNYRNDKRLVRLAIKILVLFLAVRWRILVF